MKTALIMGATGLIGTELLKILIEQSDYDEIKVLTRRKLKSEHERLIQIKYDYEWPDKELIKADDVFCCLGTTIKKAGSQEGFRRVDFDYIIETAHFAWQNGSNKFILVSSIGANINSKVFYSKIKGETENNLRSIGFNSLYILRPSLLLGSRAEFRMAEVVGAFMSTAFSFAIPEKYKAIEAKTVAKAMLSLANSDKTGINIIESDEIATFS